MQNKLQLREFVCMFRYNATSSNATSRLIAFSVITFTVSFHQNKQELPIKNCTNTSLKSHIFVETYRRNFPGIFFNGTFVAIHATRIRAGNTRFRKRSGSARESAAKGPRGK